MYVLLSLHRFQAKYQSKYGRGVAAHVPRSRVYIQFMVFMAAEGGGSATQGQVDWLLMLQ